MADNQPIESGKLSVSDIEEMLGEDTPDLETTEGKEETSLSLDDSETEPTTETRENKKNNETEEKPEEDDEELKLGDELDEEDGLVTPPKRAEILKKFPELFKTFPFMEKALYREQKYTEMFGTVQDAEDIKQAAETYQGFENDLLKGDLGTVLSSVKNADGAAFEQMVDNWLPMLAKVDEKAYYHVLGDTIKRTLIQTIDKSQNLGEEDFKQVKLAASIIYQAIFGPGKYTPPQKFGRGKDAQPSAEESKLNQERTEFFQERLDNAVSSLDSNVTNLIRNTINENIDKNDTMSPYTKRNAIRDAQEILDKQLSEDQRYQDFKDRLWQKAIETNFSQESLRAIKKAHSAKCKALLPAILKKVRSAALNSQTNRRVNESDNTRRDTTLMERPAAQTRNAGNNKERGKPNKGESSLDFLNRD